MITPARVTDATRQPAVDALGPGVGELVELLSGGSEAIVAAGRAPADLYDSLPSSAATSSGRSRVNGVNGYQL